MLIEKGADLRREACLMACFGRYLKFAVDPSLRDAEGARFDPFEPGLSDEDWSKVREADPAAILRIRALQAFGLADQADFRHWFNHYAALLAGQGMEAALQDMLS